jgi:dihydrofolate reductase
MRKLIVISFLTLDGVMQAPGAKHEDTQGEFEYGGWQMSFDDGGDTTLHDEMSKAGALLLGRKTYDIFSGYWPTEGKNIEFWGPLMNSLPKFIASNTLKKTDWQNSKLLKSDIKAEVSKLKSEPGKDIYIFGSGDLCQTLMRDGQIDEYFLMVYPLVLGKGKKLFREGSAKQDLELFSSKTIKSGILILRYKRLEHRQ